MQYHGCLLQSTVQIQLPALCTFDLHLSLISCLETLSIIVKSLLNIPMVYFALFKIFVGKTKKFARNCSISYGFQDIHTFSFSAKIQDGCQKWRKLKFFPFAQDTLVLPCGSNIHSKSL